jgi:hypothetical protein
MDHEQQAREMLVRFSMPDGARHMLTHELAAILERGAHYAAQARIMEEAHQDLCDMVPALPHETVRECVARLVARDVQMRDLLSGLRHCVRGDGTPLLPDWARRDIDAALSPAPIAAEPAQPAPVAQPVEREEPVAWLFKAHRPGKWLEYASVDQDEQPGIAGPWPDFAREPLYTAAALTSARAAARREALEDAQRACLSLWDLRDDERARMYAAKCADAIDALLDAQG